MFSFKRRGMEMPINVVVILIVLLVVLAISLMLVSRGGTVFSDSGADKIETAGSVTSCERLCWSCCRIDTEERCNDPLYHAEIINCNCIC